MSRVLHPMRQLLGRLDDQRQRYLRPRRAAIKTTAASASSVCASLANEDHVIISSIERMVQLVNLQGGDDLGGCHD